MYCVLCITTLNRAAIKGGGFFFRIETQRLMNATVSVHMCNSCMLAVEALPFIESV